MTERRRYTKRQKVTAVIAADMTSQEAAAEATGIPRTTIRYWLEDPEMAALRHNAREAIAEEAIVVARLAWRRLAQVINDLEPRDLVIATGMATDKAQLLGGHATDRTELRDITDPILGDHEKRQMADFLHSLPSGPDREVAEVAEDAAVADSRETEPATA